ncbi:hypothetical protein EJ02DRAFT_506647 [Clathrospora elynae]|uniref:Uncharacterized protein n=1 Tax=Clathrospora elynae TaxID=706981 RepID=A0A6A5S9C7_9PLEO|nr:hypothetical protein EJ02DRAFT_506647 [Clathrospora elynae]
MGFAYRTPSPAPSAYISSSVENSPQSAPALGPDSQSGYESFKQRSQKGSFDLTVTGDGMRMGRPSATFTRFHNVFGANRNYAGQSYTLENKDEESVAVKNRKELFAAFKEPRTPMKNRTGNLWHGLPSPETSNLVTYPSDPPSVGSSNKAIDTVEHTLCDVSRVLEDVGEQDAQLDRELSQISHRRSARLRTMAKPRFSEATDLSIVPSKADPIPFQGFPIVQSLDWQLQYPPGGSTHPSYPFPALDPRLVFHQSFVPVTDGLPDITRVPELVLPMGWKQVSWAGLLPIAFDPYRQSFKLTPVGPLPLTCEELRQGGLHKYVPGGELHPESEYLPQMMKLSDGSADDVYDFDSVDWTLPWGGHESFYAPASPSTDLSSPNSGTGLQPTSPALPTVIVHPWKEARDCPNMVFDLSDGWRWLAEKERQPFMEFIPTPWKQWRGTGAIRSSRKLKSPIPELMMLASQLTSSTPNDIPNPTLQKQDSAGGLKSYNEFCPFKSISTPMNVDITSLSDTEFTVMEILSYFPQHYNWGHAAERLTRASMGPAMIRNTINMTRALEGETVLDREHIAYAVNTAKKRDLARPEEADIEEATRDQTPKPTVINFTMSYTAEGWIYEVWNKIDYPLLALAHGLQSLPTGVDAGPLTELIIWCREQGRYQVLISEVPALLKEAGIEPLIEAGECGCPDKEVMSRHADAIKMDKLRISKTAGEKKRVLDGGEEGKKEKRRKTE